MKQTDSEKTIQKKEQARFNAITNKSKVENQNQQHNSKKEGSIPVNQQR